MHTSSACARSFPLGCPLPCVRHGSRCARSRRLRHSFAHQRMLVCQVDGPGASGVELRWPSTTTLSAVPSVSCRRATASATSPSRRMKNGRPGRSHLLEVWWRVRVLLCFGFGTVETASRVPGPPLPLGVGHSFDSRPRRVRTGAPPSPARPARTPAGRTVSCHPPFEPACRRQPQRPQNRPDTPTAPRCPGSTSTPPIT